MRLKALLADDIRCKQLLKSLSKYCENPDLNAPYFTEVDPQTLPVWQMWNQGLDKIPPLVKICFSSLDKQIKKRQIVRLAYDAVKEQNFGIPEAIFHKYEKGLIGQAHFSDIVRLAVLTEFGGTWLDSTIYLSDTLPLEITSQSFFVFRSLFNFTLSANTLFSNWFIHAKPKHIIIRNILKSLLTYWLNEDSAIDYLMFHYIAYLLIMRNQELSTLWATLPQIPNVDCVYTQDLFERPSEETLTDLLEKTPIHKLNLKMRWDVPGSIGPDFMKLAT